MLYRIFAGGIWRAYPDGSDREQIVANMLASELALDRAGVHLYWAEDGLMPSIHRATLNGMLRDTFLLGIDALASLALDLRAKTIYWNERDRIRRSDFDGSSAEDLWTGLDHPGSLAISYRETSSAADVVLPVHLLLHQNRPNPFNAATQIGFYLDKPKAITLSVYNIAGREVAHLAEGGGIRQANTALAGTGESTPLVSTCTALRQERQWRRAAWCC